MSGAERNLTQFLLAAAAQFAARPALQAFGRTALSYSQLGILLNQSTATFRKLGIGPADTVAIVLPNGPEMASAFLTTASACCSAPLNPAYKAEELDFYLSDLNASALIVAEHDDGPAVAVARQRSIPVLRLCTDPHQPAGYFTLRPDTEVPFPSPSFNSVPEALTNTALVLHTSGTTSRPKLVPLSQGNLVASARHIAETLRLSPDDHCLNLMPLFHIHGLVGVLLSSLGAGASVTCSPGFLAPKVLGWLGASQATWYSAVPTMHQAIVARTRQETMPAHRLRFIRSSSAALPPQVMQQLEEVFDVPVVESYGMTEAAHQMASNPLPPSVRKPGSVGPSAGSRIAVMDAAGNVLPQGDTGEVVIQGPNVTKGYVANPKANAAAFHDGWFRTGDQGYLDEDGYLFLTGRLKELINRGGEKISPREIDEALLAHPAVAQAVAFAMPDDKLGEEVAAAVVLHEGKTADESALQHFAAARLADFKVPRRIVLLNEIPKGPTGKLQRINLAEKLGLVASSTATVAKSGGHQPTETGDNPLSFVAPRTETETQVVAFFAEVLGLPPAGIDQHFFEAGGDSITAAQLLARISAFYGGAPSLVRFFQTPTPRDLAMWLEGFQSATALSPVRQGIPRQPEGAAPQPSPAQEAMWFLDLLEQDRRVLLRPAAWRLRGPLDRQALTRALETIVARHEALRQQFQSADGRLEVRIQQNVATQVAFHELRNLPQEQRSTAAETLSREIALRPFALDREPVFRAALLQLQKDEHWLVFTVHHIVSDGWSGTVFENDLRQAYAHFATGAPLLLPELSVGYRDYCAWLRGRVHSADWNAQLTYWKNELEAAPPYLSLPYDRPQDSLAQTPPDLQNSGGQVRCTLPSALTQRLQSFTTESRHTLFMVLLAAFQALLSRISHARDIVVATPFANRSHPELENLIGLFINLLPLRARLEEASTFNDLLMQARAAGLQAHANQEVPFDTILSAINPAREGARTPFMQVLFQVRNYPRQATDWPGLEAEPLHVDWQVCGFDLSLEVEEREEQLHLLLNYNHAAFESSTAERILLRYQTLLESALAAPEAPVSTLNWLPNEERGLVLQQWNQTEAPVHDGFIDAFVEEQAARFPDRVAMLEETTSIHYGELNARADRIAAGLRAKGVLPGDLVAIAIERSIDAAVCSLAVLKIGGVFVPLEIDHPQPRLRRILDSAKPRLVLCSTRARALQPELAVNWLHAVDCEAVANGAEAIGDRQPRTTTPAESGAYVMYTSGSSGVPKGVLVGHRAAINFMQGFDDLYGFGDKDCQLWKANCSFDVSIQEWLVPLMLGGTVAICPPGRQADIPFLLDFMETHRVTTIDGVPAFHRLLLEAQHQRPRKLSLRYQLVGAAPMSRDLERFLIEHSQWPVHNQYGPTEATVYATVQPCQGETPGSIVPLGRPMRNARAYVLDEQRNPVGVGVSGEIWLGGEGVALGYWNDPAATAERFFPDPFRPAENARMYRTGDLGRWLPDGRLEFLGRVDNQVKLRGFRIELEDIESALESLPGVRHAAVILVGSEEESACLAAWVESEAGTVLEESVLRQQAAALLPTYMVPSVWHMTDSLPRNAVGKLNRRALSEPSLNAPPAFRGSTQPHHNRDESPRDATEVKIAEIWIELLPGTQPGIHDDFFELGGHSLKAVVLMSRIEKELGARLPLPFIFEARTIAQLAARVKQQTAALAHSTRPSLLVPLQTKGTRTPLVLLHALGGHVLFYRELAEAMGSHRPVYAMQALGSDGTSSPYTNVASMAKHYVQELESAGLLHQPLILGGFCFGAYLAIEMAALVEARGGKVLMLMAFDTDGEWRTVSSVADSVRFHARQLQRRGLGGWPDYFQERLFSRRRRKRIQRLGAIQLAKLRQGQRLNSEEAVDAVWAANALASERYKPKPFTQPLLYLKGVDAPPRDPSIFWGPLAQGGLDILEVPGREFSMFEQPAVGVLAERLTWRINASEGPAEAPASQAAAAGQMAR